MTKSTKTFIILLLFSLGLILWDYPWPYRPPEGEVLLKVKPTGCTCAELYVLEGQDKLKASSQFSEITRYDQIFYEIEVELPVDSSADLYWLTGSIVGFRSLVEPEHRPPDSETEDLENNHFYPIFKVSQGKWAQFSFWGFAGMGFAILNTLGFGMWWLVKTLIKFRPSK